MLGRTHIAINGTIWSTGVAVIQGVTWHPQILPATAGLALVVLASRVADIDTPDSGAGKQLDTIMPGLPRWLDNTFGHRKSPTHWALSAVFVGGLAAALAIAVSPSLWWIGLAIGGSWLAHILADCCTWMGAAAFAPITRKMIRLPYGRRIECGGWIETEIVAPLAWALFFASVLCFTAQILKHAMG
jgi:membrane-bound metal-dependent hydrolase YbcI (DUF457 family)